MRIAILGPTWFPVPPRGYGGIEMVVSLLADGLVDGGHDVTLFASGDSRTKADLVSYFDEAPSSRIGTTQADLLHALTCFERAEIYDVVNDHSGPLAAVMGCLTETPVVHTVHGPLTGEWGEIYRKLGAVAPGLGLVSLSRNQQLMAPALRWLGNCPNAVDARKYPLRVDKGDYVLFLGRMNREKGAHRAIDVARAAGMPIKLAAKCREPEEELYFEEQVRPLLGADVEYLGEVTHEEKVALLQEACALVFPIDWEEPFGLVMIEAMACGTPVVATRRGAVPEVVADGVGGIVVGDSRDLVSALPRALELDPVACRRDVEERFAPERMVERYLAVFERAAQGELEPVG